MSENKNLNVSYSSIDTYLNCSEKYRLERICKIQPEAISTSFFFGKVIDEASEVIFKPFMKDQKQFDRNEMIQKFKYKLTNIEYQKDIIYAPTCLLIKYTKADVQAELLEKEDLEIIQKHIDKSDLIIDDIHGFIQYFKDTKIKIEDEKAIYNFIAWHCLYRKGIMMLDTLKDWADKNISEVISLQRKIEIKNDSGDILVGYIDLEARLKHDGVIRTLDLKTATSPHKTYTDDKISKSMQLTIYAEASQKSVGYIVLDKEIKKKHPKVRIKELYGEITEEQLDKTFEDIDKAMEGIRAEKFEKNLSHCFSYGVCPFYNLCTRKDTKGLISRSNGSKITLEELY